MRLALTSFLLAAALAAMAPLWQCASAPSTEPTPAFAGWPDNFEGRPLTALPLTAAETRFAAGFPGRTARFTDGRREIIMRWIAAPSRKLHPASDCLRSTGYSIQPRAPIRDQTGQTWGAFTAARHGQHMNVRERISDMQGRSWTDVSAWYWAAVLGRTTGPWQSVTVAE